MRASSAAGPSGPDRARDASRAIATSSAVYVLVAATACSGPARQVDDVLGRRRERRRRIVGDGEGRLALVAGRLDDGDDVRRRAGLADPDDERALEARQHPVERDDRRRRERDRQAMPRAEQVLRVDRGVIGGATGGDDDLVDTRPRARRRPPPQMASLPRSRIRATEAGCSRISSRRVTPRRLRLASPRRPAAGEAHRRSTGGLETPDEDVREGRERVGQDRVRGEVGPRLGIRRQVGRDPQGDGDDRLPGSRGRPRRARPGPGPSRR